MSDQTSIVEVAVLLLFVFVIGGLVGFWVRRWLAPAGKSDQDSAVDAMPEQKEAPVETVVLAAAAVPVVPEAVPEPVDEDAPSNAVAGETPSEPRKKPARKPAASAAAARSAAAKPAATPAPKAKPAGTAPRAAKPASGKTTGSAGNKA